MFVRVVQLKRRGFKMRCDDDREWDERRCLFLTFNNSKYTGGTMMIAPDADPSDGLIEYVRWGPIGRLGLIRNVAAPVRRNAHRASTGVRAARSSAWNLSWMRRWT